MKIGKLILDADGNAQQVLNDAIYNTSEEAIQAAENIKAENESNENVLHIFVAEEITTEDYRIVVIL